MTSHRKESVQSVAVMVALLEQARTWRHGYALAKATGLQSGTLYPILGRLEDRGYLESKWLESMLPGRPPRHVYRLTPIGVVFAHEVSSQHKDARQRPPLPQGIKA